MLAGTDLNYAYSYDFDPTPKPAPASQMPMQQHAPKRMEPMEKKRELPAANPNMDPNYLTSDQKLYMLSAELAKQKEMFENNKGHSYIDRLLSKKKDVIKLLVSTFVFLLAISLHHVVDHYIHRYFEENVLGTGKELLVRLLYPCAVLLVLWNIKAYNK